MKGLAVFFKKKGKKGIVSEYLPWMLIAIAILVVLMIVIFLLKDKGTSALGSLKGLFRGG